MATNVDRLLFNVAENGYSGAVDGRWKDVQKVTKLPKFGQSGILYKVPKSNAEGNNLYNEWFWTGTEFKLFMENVDDTASAGTPTADTNTTYTLVKDPDNGRTIILKGSDGSSYPVTIDEANTVDTNTTYTLDVRDGTIYLIPSEGEGQEFKLPVQDVSGLATKEELKAVQDSIPTIPSDVSAFTNDAGYLTEHQDISNLATKAEVEAVEKKIPTVPDISNFATKEDVKAVKDAIPAAYDDKELREGLQKVQEDVAGITDNNTTYTLEKDPNDHYTAHLKGSDGSDSPVTFPDKDTVYDDGPLKKEIEDIKTSIPAAYDDSDLRALIKDLQDRIAVLEKTASVGADGVVADVDGSVDPDTGVATLSNSTIDDNGIVTLR